MKKILFVSAAALALSFASCKKDAPAQEAPAQVEAAAEAAAPQAEAAAAEAAAQVENAVLKGLQESVAAIKTAAEAASKEDVPAVVESIKQFKETYEAAKASLNAEEQAGIESAINAIVELIKTK